MYTHFKTILHLQKPAQIVLATLLGIAPCFSAQINLKEMPINFNHLHYFGQHMHHLVDKNTALQGTTLFPSPLANGVLPVGAIRTWDSGTGLWSIIEPKKGVFNWVKLDKFVSIAEEKGAEVIHTIGAGTPAWASARPSELFVYGLGGASEPANNNDYIDYITQLFTRYKGRIKYYEIWNEPSFTGPAPAGGYAGVASGFYSGTAEKLFELHKITAEVLHSVDPNAKILAPGFDGTEKLDKYLQSVIATGLNFNDYTDYISFHFYSKFPEAILNVSTNVKLVLQKNGISGLPIMNTESGFTTPTSIYKPQVSLENFPGWVARSFILGLYIGLDKFMYYSYDGFSGLNVFSAPTKSTTPPPGTLTSAGIANTTIANWLTGATMGNCYYADDSVIFCELNRKNLGIARLTWRSDDKISDFVIPAKWGRPLEVENLDGVTKYNIQKTHSILISGAPSLIKNTTKPWAYDAYTPISKYTLPKTTCGFTSYNYKEQVKHDKPLIYYKLEQNLRTIIYDYSGHNNNGTLNINYPQSKVSGALYQADDGAMSFNPNSLNKTPVIETPKNANPLSGDFSIEFWSKQNDFSPQGEQLGFGSGKQQSNGFRIGPRGTVYQGTWRVWTAESGGGAEGINLSTKIPLNTNTWYHIVLTHRTSDNRTQFFINGLLDSETNSGTFIPPTEGKITIGGGYSWNLYGALDEVAIYDHVLTKKSIQMHYQVGTNNCYFIRIDK